MNKTEIEFFDCIKKLTLEKKSLINDNIILEKKYKDLRKKHEQIKINLFKLINKD